MKTFLVLCASRLLKHLAITPLAAQNKAISLFDTTRCAILVEDFASDGMLFPMLERESILGNTTGRRPGDVTIQRWAEGKALAVDIAVTSPLAANYVSKKETCE